MGDNRRTINSHSEMNMSSTWQLLEADLVRYAAARWCATARPETVAGVRCDCVVDLGDRVILIEVSEEETLAKLRQDIAKFAVLRYHYLHKNVLPVCYFIMRTQPNPSLVESGREAMVKVLSIEDFWNEGLGTTDYITRRTQHPFGSAVDLYTGKPDQGKYVPVRYFGDDGREYTALSLSELLRTGKKIVLLGDFGSGKSRCVKEVFGNLLPSAGQRPILPLAINLRDSWGLKRSNEIVSRHLDDLGLSKHTEDTRRISTSDLCVYLLDGFDEIGSQAWSGDPTKLREIRRASLVGVKEIVRSADGGVLVPRHRGGDWFRLPPEYHSPL